MPAVEDSGNGLRSAAAAGMTVIAVPNQHFPPEPQALAQADDVIASLSELTPARLRRVAADARVASGATRAVRREERRDG